VAGGRHKWIRAEARRALVLAGATRPDQIDPIRTAKALEIDVVYGGIDGATERITMIGDRTRIRVSDAIVLPGRENFTISHAIGHKLCGHAIAVDGDVAGWIRAACGNRETKDERESDVFATEHLTPEEWVRPYCVVPRVDLDATHAIARVFPVSPVMAAVRFIELSKHACAVVYAERGAVKWARANRTFPRWIQPGMRVPVGSIAHGFFARSALDDRPQRSRARGWLPESTRITDQTEIIEHAMVVPQPGWGGVLSLLWIPELPTVSPRTLLASRHRDRRRRAIAPNDDTDPGTPFRAAPRDATSLPTTLVLRNNHPDRAAS